MNNKDESTIAAIEQQLHIPGKYGPWWTARRLLQECWKHKPSVLRNTTFDLRDLPFMGAARDILWRRPLGPHMVGRWVHHYDKNSQYLSACRGVRMGIGDPIHMNNRLIVSGLPGIYHIADFTMMGAFGPVFYPPIIEPDQQWITDDVLRFALEQGYILEVDEAWVFPDYTKVLNRWAGDIWRARLYFKHRNPAAYAEMKAIATVGVGSFATSEEKHPGLDLIHPNWWADVVGKARVNMLANLLKFGSPVLIRTDSLWYVSRDPNYRTAVPGILDRMTECGGYKYESSFQLTEELYNQAQGLGHAELAKLFHDVEELEDTGS